MVKSFEDLVLYAHQKFLKTKRLRHYINSFHFQQAYALANKDQIQELIDKGDLNDLKKYTEKLLDGNLEMQRIGNLREIARRHHVKNYHCLTREQLIEGIENEKINKSEDHQETKRCEDQS
jgi:hypothetical protein